ncbi:MAG: DUF927 domain-containing protein [Gammaproteobacteria bacterium]
MSTGNAVPLKKLIASETGIYYQDEAGSHKICGPLKVVAMVRDKVSENWARLLEFKDADGKLHLWTMPMELLRGNGDELCAELLRLGLDIAPGLKVRHLLLEHIASSITTQRARCVQQIGWHHSVFVLPHKIIGETTERIILKTPHSANDFASAGNLAEWQEKIAKLCAGNSRLILAISAAFAALLLKPAGAESGGIHLVGESSTGKTTALRVAASVFGPPGFMQRWRATANGIETLAAMRSDTLLVLDELAQVDAKEAGEVAYMLANGSGKIRADKRGNICTPQNWRLLFLSAGEISLEQHLSESGKRVKVGQMVRMADIPSDAGMGQGLFEVVPSGLSAAQFSQQLTQAASNCYGTAAIAFLESITQLSISNILPSMLDSLCRHFVKQYLPTNSSGQVHRICERFALIAVAGELATDFEITGWQPGEATQNIAKCFKDWLSQRGDSGNLEYQHALSQVRAFFEKHGASRFSSWYMSDSAPPTPNRAGFKKIVDGVTYFYVLTEVFKRELCQGLDFRRVSQWLLKANCLIGDHAGNPYRREYLPQMGRSRCYVFTEKIWEELENK